jgi:hypothetical protein
VRTGRFLILRLMTTDLGGGGVRRRGAGATDSETL